MPQSIQDTESSPAYVGGALGSDLLGAMLRHKSIVCVTMVGALGLGCLSYLNLNRVYRSSAQILLVKKEGGLSQSERREVRTVCRLRGHTLHPDVVDSKFDGRRAGGFAARIESFPLPARLPGALPWDHSGHEGQPRRWTRNPGSQHHGSGVQRFRPRRVQDDRLQRSSTATSVSLRPRMRP